MTKTPFLAAASLAAAIALSACNSEDRNIVAGDDDPQAEALKKAPPIAPPPMIQASRIYRCKGNSLLYAEFYTNHTVRVRTEKDAPSTTLTAENGQPPYKAEGWSLSANANQVSFTSPQAGTLSCKTR